MTSCLVNGEAVSELDSSDRGLAYGDGLFETLLARPGYLPQWQVHMARLENGCERLGLPQADPSSLKHDALSLLDENGVGVIKIIVTRGIGGRGYAAPENASPNVIVRWSAKPEWPDNPWRGITARRCELTLSSQPVLAGIKHLNRLEQVLARSEWSDDTVREGLLCDMAGNVVEGVSSNLVAVFDGLVVVPALNEQGVAGIMQRRLLASLEAKGICCEQRLLPWNELIQAKSLVITNAVVGCWPITRLLGENDLALTVPNWLPALQQQFDSEDGVRRHCDS